MPMRIFYPLGSEGIGDSYKPYIVFEVADNDDTIRKVVSDIDEAINSGGRLVSVPLANDKGKPAQIMISPSIPFAIRDYSNSNEPFRPHIW
jgi:hypothetical protein